MRQGWKDSLATVVAGRPEKIAYFGGRQQALDVGGSYSYQCNKKLKPFLWLENLNSSR